MSTITKKIRVLVVDDQAIVREVIRRGLEQDPQIEVVGMATDPYAARDQIVKLNPDVVTLDVEMPRMNGVEFLKKLMPQYPLPVIMVSSLTQAGRAITLEALEAGAVDFVAKPSGDAESLKSMMEELRTKVQAAARVDVARWAQERKRAVIRGLTRKTKRANFDFIVIGASTGGTEAIRFILGALPADCPGLVIVQHMPPGFTRTFAERLNDLCALEVKEAESGDMVTPGRALVAPGDLQCAIRRYGAAYKLSVFEYDKVEGHRPSVDVLFHSAAESGAGPRALGLILTGMGRDGARGMEEMRRSGCRTIGQGERSSVVYGMPKVAFELGAVEFQEELEDIPHRIVELLDRD